MNDFLNDFLTMLASVALIILFAVFVFPAVMTLAERVLDRLFGNWKDLP